jgi:hypothetical protein
MRMKCATVGIGSLAVLVLAVALGTDATGAPIQQFATAGIAEIGIVHCYDTLAANEPVQVAGRLECNASNPAILPSNTAVRAWTVVNLPVGNRLAQPVTFTPSGADEWQQAFVPCAPVDANNACTAAGALAVGDMSGRSDFGCETNIDVFATNESGGGNIELWPNDSLWNPLIYDRIAAAPSLDGGGALTGGADAYIHDAVLFPRNGSHAWAFQTSERATLRLVYLDGTGPLNITATKINRVTYASTYLGQEGLSVTATLVGDAPDQPPNDKQLCADSPLDSVVEVGYLITPNADTRIPRWTTLQSALDLGDSSVDRILDWQCDIVGTPSDGDADADCDPDASDGNDASRDSDSDLVPDGVERAYGSNPAMSDTDGDGCNDYCEIFQYSDPNDADTDNDGQADKPDEASTNAVGLPSGDDLPTTGTDALDLTDDNCPVVTNADQRNTDAMYQFHGMGTGTGDATNPDEDPYGDACDTDADNDDLPGATEASMRIKAWTGYSGGQTTVCVGAADVPNFSTHVLMSDLLGDVDQDYILDGQECISRSRPDISIRGTASAAGTVLNCSTAAPPGGTLAGGCAQPGLASHAPGSDADTDGLYVPGSNGTGIHAGVEARFRTRQINIAAGTQLHDIDDDGVSTACPLGLPNPNGEGDKDSDRDVKGAICQASNLQDGVEVRAYGTSPAAFDTDQDGCPDADEVNDITGDGNTNSGDQGAMASRIPLGSLDNNADGMFDEYVIAMIADLNKDGFVSSGDQGILAATIAATGNCQAAGFFVEDNVDTGALTKHLP